MVKSNHATLDESTLLLQIVEREEQALATVFDLYGHHLYCLALEITGEQALAERTIEQVFAALWSCAAKLPTSDLEDWLIVSTRIRSLAALAQQRIVPASVVEMS